MRTKVHGINAFGKEQGTIQIINPASNSYMQISYMPMRSAILFGADTIHNP